MNDVVKNLDQNMKKMLDTHDHLRLDDLIPLQRFDDFHVVLAMVGINAISIAKEKTKS